MLSVNIGEDFFSKRKDHESRFDGSLTTLLQNFPQINRGACARCALFLILVSGSGSIFDNSKHGRGGFLVENGPYWIVCLA